jgi:CRP/FNR family transcriptional regulator, cyclic AMP receptor protein
VLRALPLFAPLTDDEATKLAAAASWEAHVAGAVIFRDGESVGHFWIVESGSVVIEISGPDHSPRRLHTVETGELLGWSPLLGGAAMTATGRVLESARLLSFDAAAVLALCETDQGLGFRLMRNVARALAARLNSTRLQLLDAFHIELPPIMEGAGS